MSEIPELLTVPNEEEDFEKEIEKRQQTDPNTKIMDSFFVKKLKQDSIVQSPLINPSSTFFNENIFDTIKEQGVLVPISATFIKQFQSELSKFIGERISKVGINDDLKVFFKRNLIFRNTTFSLLLEQWIFILNI